MAWLLFAIIIILPLAEIFAFIEVGSAIGALPTLALIVLTAVAGAFLVRWQGLKVIRDARQSLARDELPLDAAVHGLLLLFAGLLLLTPGFVTDTAGFLLLLPPVRSFVAPRIWRWLQARATVRATVRTGPAGRRRRPDIIEGEAVEIDRDRKLHDRDRGASPWTTRDGTAR